MNATYTLTIGKRGTYPVESLAEASTIYAQKRDASGQGYKSFPEGTITPGDFRVSYNGRVWPAGPWAQGVQPLYDPAGGAK